METNYKKLVQEAKQSTTETSAHLSEQLVVLFFRKLGFYVAPFFLKLNISANKITVIGLILGVWGAVLLWDKQVIGGVCIYFIVTMLESSGSAG